MMEELLFRKAKESDIQKLDELNNIGFENWNSEFFDELMQPSFAFVSEIGGEFTGVEGYIGYKLLRDGKTFQSHRSERTIVHPSMRGRGVFEKLVHECHQESIKTDSVFCWGATSALKPFQRAGFKSFEKWRRYYFIPIRSFNLLSFPKDCITAYRKFKEFKAEKTIDNFIVLGSAVSNLIPLPHQFNRQFEVVEIKPKAYVELYDELSLSNDFKLKVDNNILEWLIKRKIQFKCIKIMNGLKVEAISIYKYSQNSIVLLDWIFINSISWKNGISSFRNYIKKISGTNCPAAITIAFNIQNESHLNDIKSLPIRKIKSPRVGSFVIHPGTLDVGIEKLQLTPIWLEL